MTTSAFRRAAFVAAVAASALFVAPGARADAQDDAKSLFARGREYRASDDCASAAQLFRRAYALYPQGLGSLRNLAECEEILGHFASSRRSWLDLKRALITMPNDAKYEGWERDSEDAANRLKPKVASFIVDVYVKSSQGEAFANDQTGVEIMVNGESVGTTLVGSPIERDPGLYRIRAQMSDAAPVEQTVQLNAGDNPHVTIRITRKPKEETLREQEAASSAQTRKIAGWVTIAAGGVFLIGGGVTFLMRQSALSDVKDGCPDLPNTPQVEYEDGPCPVALKDTIDRGKTMSVLSPLLAGVGLLGVGVGAALVLTAPSHEKHGKGFRLTAGFGRLDAQWRF